MTSEKNKPVIQNRDRLLSASVFSREVDFKSDGNYQTVYSVCVQRSYQKKDSQEWFRENINLSPDECLRLANLLIQTYNRLITHVQEQKKSAQSADYPAQPMETPADLNDDIPF